jgi:Fe-S-cluster containining protein
MINASYLHANITRDSYGRFQKRLKTIFAEMDRKYKQAADGYGFDCKGCEDNCCMTRFYHHTVVEYVYILKGFNALDNKTRHEVKRRAAEVCRKTISADEKGEPVRLMCPLNFDGLCRLYAYRPMICRLHGIPHELHQSGREVVHRPGCGAFAEAFHDKNYFKFDRTPFFIEMAGLEKEFKQVLGLNQKFKMTVAQMVNTF